MRQKITAAAFIFMLLFSSYAFCLSQSGLSPAELTKIQEELRRRCNLQQADIESYPWYYHYELGLALNKAKDWQRAIESFQEALERRQKPSRFNRTYGVWFIRYWPYYQMGVAYYHLRNWDCALRAFDASEKLEDLTAKSGELKTLQMLKSDTLRQLSVIRD